MSHIDTLEAYKELIESGVEPKEAEAHVKLLNASFDSVVTQKDLDTRLNLMEYDLKMFFTFELVGVVIFLISIPAVMSFLMNKFGWGQFFNNKQIEAK